MEIEEDGGIGTYFRHLEYRCCFPQLVVSSSSNTNFLNCESGYRGELECTSDVKKVLGRYLYPALTSISSKKSTTKRNFCLQQTTITRRIGTFFGPSCLNPTINLTHRKKRKIRERREKRGRGEKGDVCC